MTATPDLTKNIGAPPYDGSTAEVIAEDPFGGSSGSKTSGHDLANFGSFEVHVAQAIDSGGPPTESPLGPVSPW